MNMTFFIGAQEQLVNAIKYGNCAQHYAWCLYHASIALSSAHNKKEQIRVLEAFQTNMELSPETLDLLKMQNDTFSALLNSPSKLNNQYIFELISGFCIHQKGYLSL